MPEPKVAIILPFISLNSYVFECIEHCLSLNYSNFSLVLLPNGKIELPSHLENNPKLKVIETGDITIAAKRNKGIEEVSESRYYGFIDSDAYPQKDWLKNAIEVSEKSEDIYAVGGPILCPANEEFKRRVISNALKSKLIKGIRAKDYREDSSQDRICSYLPTCNLILKREAIEKVGKFDEGYITGEDKELCARLVKKNMKIFFSKNVIVYHHSRRFLLPFIKQRIIHGYSVIKSIRRYHNFLNLCFLFPLISVLFIISILSFFSHVYFLLLFSLFYLIIVLIESLRWSSHIRETPFIFVAIFFGCPAPAIGTLLSLFDAKIKYPHNFNQSV